jgi:hypothetical protein
MRPPIAGPATVVVVGLFFGLCAWAMLQNADALVGDIHATLAFAPPPDSGLPPGVESGSLELTTAHEPLSDAARGIQMAIFTMLVGGLPAALTALVLARRSDSRHQRWRGWWVHVFVVGFIFQLGSLFFASVFLFILIIASDGGRHLVGDLRSLIVTAAALLTVVGSFAALRAWRSLRASASQQPPTLA